MITSLARTPSFSCYAFFQAAGQHIAGDQSLTLNTHVLRVSAEALRGEIDVDLTRRKSISELPIGCAQDSRNNLPLMRTWAKYTPDPEYRRKPRGDSF